MAPKTKRGSKTRPSLVVYGDIQAEAIRHVFEHIPQLAERYDLAHIDSSSVAPAAVPPCTVLFEQTSTANQPVAAAAGTRVRFPSMQFRLLWPFNCSNPWNAPAPPAFPSGPFPNGDSFLLSCATQNVSLKDAIGLYLRSTWADSWPSLDALLAQEVDRMTALDAAHDVPIGMHILKEFRKQRLFVAPSAPTDILLCELILQLLDAAFPNEPAIVGSDVPGILSSLGHRDYFGMFALPIHPLVAQHFQLVWLEPNARYNYFDREQLSGKAYYERFMTYVLERYVR